jgi:beta-galactosidase
LAHVVRLASSGRKLVVFFYGYLFEFGAVSNGPATSGHYALRRVLNCPDIDVLCGPISYFDRELGQNAPSMTAAESVALAGKMWFNEDDTRTHLSTHFKRAAKNLIETNSILVRNTSQCALRNIGTWWMDLKTTGWFNDTGIWAEMKRLDALDEPMLHQPLHYRPQVAAVIDEASIIRIAAGGQVLTKPGIYNVRQALGRMGTPYGQYLLDDITAGKVPARLYVMLATWYLSPEQRRQLLTAIHGAVRVWCYAPGYMNPKGTSLEAMHELTGFRFRKVDLPRALAQPTAIGEKLGLRETYGVQETVKPLFAVDDATNEEILATYLDGSAAVAMRKTSEGLSIFVGTQGLTSELLRIAALRADVHLFTEEDCNVYASGPYLSIHTSQDGPLGLNTGRSGHVLDILTGESLGQGPRIVLSLKQGETRVLKYD